MATNIHRLKSDDELGREASAWIACLDAGASEEEKQAFTAWRKADPRHERAWKLTLMVWRQMIDAGRLARAVSNGHQFNSLTEHAIQRSLQARRKVRGITFASAAALLVATVGLAWFVQTNPARTEFQTAVGEHSTVNLPDGSTLELNSESRAKVEYTADRRVVRLERGEAYFDVQNDPKRPFWVAAGKSWVGAVGTAFNVDMRPAMVRVTVSEGAVKVVASNSDPMSQAVSVKAAPLSLVKAGQQADVQPVATQVRSLLPAQLTRSLSWREGSIYFERERLVVVVDELNRYTADKIVIEDESVGDRLIGGTFETNARGAEVLLANLQEGLGLNVRRVNGVTYLTHK